MENKILLIVDPQIDFITGSLPVPGAVDAMDGLAKYITDSGGIYSHIIITADRHPIGHCSFLPCGGPWPRHCVADSQGAAIWPPLMETLYDCPCPVSVLHKGENPGVEEYSIFKNPENAAIICHLIKSSHIGNIDICGLAGDICVAETLRDGLKLIDTAKFNILTRFSPSIDRGETLQALINENDLSSDL